MQKYLPAMIRILLALVFFGAVLLKLMEIMGDPNGYVNYQIKLGALGLAGVFAPLLILVQFVAGLSLLLGYKTKQCAYVLAGLALFLAIILGRVDFQSMLIYLGIMAGLLLLAQHPETPCALDNLKK
jgi:putative oxidoreductase